MPFRFELTWRLGASLLAAARCSRRRSRARSTSAAQAAAPAPSAQRTIVPPKLVDVRRGRVPAAARSRRARAPTVMLQIAITRPGTVADVSRRSSRRDPRSTQPRSRRRSSSCSTPATRRRQADPGQDRLPLRSSRSPRSWSRRRPPTSQGIVRDRATKQPIANVRVALDTGQKATTDDAGQVPHRSTSSAGEHTVTLSGDNLTTVGTNETFEASKKIDATYDVEHEEGERRRPTTRRRRSSSPRRASRSRSSRPRSPASKRRRCRARRATCSRSSRTCRASRAPRSGRARSSCGARRRRTRASTSTASACRASITTADTARSCTRTS